MMVKISPRLNLILRLVFVLSPLLLSLFLYAFGAELNYRRKVEIEWRGNRAIEIYEMEWLSSISGCSSIPPGSKSSHVKSKDPKWSGRLPPGRYCFRIRSQSADGRSGPWSKFREVEIIPKAPPGLDQDKSGHFSWTTVEMAPRYLFTVRRSDGGVIKRVEITENFYAFPKDLLEDGDVIENGAEFSVQTIVENLPPSIPRTKFVSPEDLKRLGKVHDVQVLSREEKAERLQKEQKKTRREIAFEEKAQKRIEDRDEIIKFKFGAVFGRATSSPNLSGYRFGMDYTPLGRFGLVLTTDVLSGGGVNQFSESNAYVVYRPASAGKYRLLFGGGGGFSNTSFGVSGGTGGVESVYGIGGVFGISTDTASDTVFSILIEGIAYPDQERTSGSNAVESQIGGYALGLSGEFLLRTSPNFGLVLLPAYKGSNLSLSAGEDSRSQAITSISFGAGVKFQLKPEIGQGIASTLLDKRKFGLDLDYMVGSRSSERLVNSPYGDNSPTDDTRVYKTKTTHIKASYGLFKFFPFGLGLEVFQSSSSDGDGYKGSDIGAYGYYRRETFSGYGPTLDFQLGANSTSQIESYTLGGSEWRVRKRTLNEMGPSVGVSASQILSKRTSFGLYGKYIKPLSSAIEDTVPISGFANSFSLRLGAQYMIRFKTGIGDIGLNITGENIHGSAKAKFLVRPHSGEPDPNVISNTVLTFSESRFSLGLGLDW